MFSHSTKVIAMQTFLTLNIFVQYKSDTNVEFPVIFVTLDGLNDSKGIDTYKLNCMVDGSVVHSKVT